MTEESKAKIRATLIGKSRPWLKGIPRTEETKAKMSISATGKYHTTESKMKISQALTGRSKTIKARMRMSEVRLGIPLSIEHKNNIRMSPIIHHYDFDHNNDFIENRKKMTRKKHSTIHQQAGRRAVIFVKDALDKGIITREFYENFLVYINQEELKLSDNIAEECTSEMIN